MLAIPRRLISIGLAIALAAPIGCVTETGGARQRRPSWRVFEGPPDLDSDFYDTGNFHGVSLFFEINPAKDLEEGKDYQVRVIPVIDGPREIYTVQDIHRVVYSLRKFDVGGIRYDVVPGAWLFVLKQRRGNLEISYRGQRIVVEARGTWTPSVFFHREHGSDEEGKWMTEHLQIGLTHIEASSRRAEWLVDRVPYRPGSSDVLRLRGALRVDAD